MRRSDLIELDRKLGAWTLSGVARALLRPEDMRTQPIEALDILTERLDGGSWDRGELARELVRLGAAHAVMIADLGRDPTRGVVTRSLVVQAADAGASRALLGRAAQGPLPDLSRPDPRAFSALVVPGPRGAGPLDVSERVLGPELRLLVGTDAEVHTWLGVFARPGAGALGRGWRAMLNELAPRLREALACTRVPFARAEGAIAVDGDGRIIAADGRSGPWLAARGREDRLPTLVRVARDGDTVEGPLDGARVHLRVGVGRLGPVWLGSLSSPGPLERSLEALLTPTQREVAEHAAVGATCAEIASALGTRVETVRTHMRDIYARLGISTRAELARHWAPILEAPRLAS